MAGTDPFAWTGPAGADHPGLSLLVAWHQQSAYIGKILPVRAGGSLELGRGSAALGPGALDAATLSARHCRIDGGADHLRVVDLGSANGLLADGARVADARLAPGAVLSLPCCHLVVVRGTPALSRLGALCSYGAWLAPRPWPIGRAVTLLGPTGTGKSSVARALHDARAPGAPFVRAALGALQPSTWRADLFGWRRGAFTGADRDGEGLLAAAAGGTLFLDELGYVDAEIQAALLTLLDGDRRYRRVGDTQERPLDAHVIAAADRDLREGFLAPLWHRLAGEVVEIPALAARREDILPLARLPRVSSRVARKLLLFPWPGNVRQLARVADRLRDSADPHAEIDAALAAEGGATSTPPSGRPTADELRARLAAGASQAELAREHGVHRAQITRWLRR